MKKIIAIAAVIAVLYFLFTRKKAAAAAPATLTTTQDLQAVIGTLSQTQGTVTIPDHIITPTFHL